MLSIHFVSVEGYGQTRRVCVSLLLPIRTLSSKGVYLLSDIFVCLVLNIRKAEESPEAFRFKCLYASLYLSC